MKRLIISMLAGLMGLGLNAQNRVDIQNRVDSQGRKTGPWKAEYEDGKTRYEGTFHEGRPVGTMTRYFKNGQKQAILVYEAGEERVEALLFHDNGKKAGAGIFLGKQKDSTWNYYSKADESLRMTEHYNKGVLDGKALRFYPSGKVSEEVQWKTGKKEGPWLQYFENGITRLSADYSDGLLNGEYRVWYAEDALMMEGVFVNDLSHGVWDYYDEAGELLYSLEYRNGIPVDQKRYQELMEKNLLVPDSLAPSGPDVEF